MTDERRVTLRKHISTPIEVTDSLSGATVGRIGNLSTTGMMLVCAHPLNDNALYQLRFQLPGTPDDAGVIDVGVHTMWTGDAATGSYQWAGVRFISISAKATRALEGWLRENG